MTDTNPTDDPLADRLANARLQAQALIGEICREALEPNMSTLDTAARAFIAAIQDVEGRMQ